MHNGWWYFCFTIVKLIYCHSYVVCICYLYFDVWNIFKTKNTPSLIHTIIWKYKFHYFLATVSIFDHSREGTFPRWNLPKCTFGALSFGYQYFIYKLKFTFCKEWVVHWFSYCLFYLSKLFSKENTYDLHFYTINFWNEMFGRWK